MKRQVRKNVFETNSSSTHSICISKKPVNIDTDRVIRFEIGEYGWEHGCVDATDYLYTAIMSFNDRDELLKKMTDILDKNNIKYYLGKAEISKSGYDDEGYTCLDNGYIDHVSETREFVDTILNDEAMFMRLLFGDSCVYTGNDNSDADYSGKDIAEETIEDYDYKTKSWISAPNPYHDSENYDYFYKDN
jgi:hypothetical protein